MRIRKKQHPVLHGIAVVLTGGMSAPVDVAMMAGKARRNKLADDEVAYMATGKRPDKVKAKGGFTAAERRYMREHVPSA